MSKQNVSGPPGEQGPMTGLFGPVGVQGPSETEDSILEKAHAAALWIQHNRDNPYLRGAAIDVIRGFEVVRARLSALSARLDEAEGKNQALRHAVDDMQTALNSAEAQVSQFAQAIVAELRENHAFDTDEALAVLNGAEKRMTKK